MELLKILFFKKKIKCILMEWSKNLNKICKFELTKLKL